MPLVRGADLALAFVAGFLLWLLNHPYQGIWHDARIYALLAAHWQNPQAYARDLFFSFGSQGDFSLFTPLFGELAGRLGLDRAARWVVVGGGLLWIAACLGLARTMLGAGFAARFAFMLGAVAIISYSPNANTFVLGENFATARSWAIPLGLASVAAQAARRQGWAAVLGLAAAALHPLLGIWPLALWILSRLQAAPALALALSPAGLVVLLGAIAPALPHVRLMNGELLAFAWESAPDIVFKALSQSRLPAYVSVLASLGLGARLGSPQWRGLYLRLLLLGVGGIGLALIVSYWLPVEIVVQGQPWRVMALLMPMAAVALVDLGRRAWQSSVAGRLLVVAVALLTSMNSHWLVGALCAMGVAGLLPMAWIGRIEAWVGKFWRWFAGGLAVLVLAALPNVLADWDLAGGQMLNPWWAGADWLHGLVAANNWHCAVLLALLPGWLAGDASTVAEPRRLSAPLVTFVLAALGLATMATYAAWDRRPNQFISEQACYLDARCTPHPFRQWVEPGSTVFWPERELTIWFELGTASYFGKIQATGKVFSAAKFNEWQRRQAWLAAGTDPRHPCGDPILDWVVLPQAVAGLSPRAVWRDSNLYACADLRALPPVSTRGAPLRAALAWAGL